MKKKIFRICVGLFLLTGILLSGCSLLEDDQTNPSDPTNDPTNPVNHRYNQEYWGEWIGIQGETVSIGSQSLTGRTWYISANQILIDGRTSSSYGSILNNLKFSKLSENVVKVNASGPYERSVIYLYASRVKNASFSGSVVSLDTVMQSFRAIGGLGNIQVTITNLTNAADTSKPVTDTNGDFIANDMIAGDTYTVSVDSQTTGVSQTAEVTPSVNGDNVGQITITNGVNFKTTVVPRTTGTDMMRLYADGTEYQLNSVCL
jgi:hypothetical protein